MNKGSVNRNAMVAIIIVILCSVGVQAIPDNTTTLCVITDRQCYCTGESVQIAVSGIPLNDTGINLTVISPDDAHYRAIPNQPDEYLFTGTSITGIYRVVAESTSGQGNHTEFEVREGTAGADNISLTTEKKRYAPGETVRIYFNAPLGMNTTLSVTGPENTSYTIPPKESNEYTFTSNFTGRYKATVILAGDSSAEKEPETEFYISAPEIKVIANKPVQNGITVGKPVRWDQQVTLHNCGDTQIMDYSPDIPLPDKYSNLSSASPDTRISAGALLIDLLPNEDRIINISYETPAVELEVTEETVDISQLIPTDAFDIGIYSEIGVEDKPRITARKVTVKHNTSVHYTNIPVTIDATENATVIEQTCGTEGEEIEVELKENNVSWVVPQLSERTYLVLEDMPVPRQKKAIIGEPVEWELNCPGTKITYLTPAPYREETPPVTENGVWKKEVTIISSASVHYHNVTAYTPVGERDNITRLYLVENNTRTDVTDNPAYSVHFSDGVTSSTNTLQWIVPCLSNRTFEINRGIPRINVQSHPVIGGNWTVAFTTNGMADLRITACNCTTWDNCTEDGDLKFLEVRKGNNPSESYKWQNSTVLIKNFTSTITNYELSKVLTTGKHTLLFTFGNDSCCTCNNASENLTVTSISFEYTGDESQLVETGDIKEDAVITVNATVKNNGVANITRSFNVSFFDGEAGNWSQWFANDTMTDLDAGETKSATVSWTSVVGTHDISVWVDPDNNAVNSTYTNSSSLDVSAWQEYNGDISGNIILADPSGNKMLSWNWGSTNTGNIYAAKHGATINWTALVPLGRDATGSQSTGNDFTNADIALNLIPDIHNATGFVNNNITQLFSTDGINPRNTTTFTLYDGRTVENIPIINSTGLTNHVSAENAQYRTGIVWDISDDTGDGEYTGSEDLVFVTNIRTVHDYTLVLPCALNTTVEGELDFYVDLK
ncbi:hypothetical protein JCM10550A_04630 [Methanogenium cariaci]